MPIVEGEYKQRTESQIRTILENELVEQFGADIDLTNSSTFTTLVKALATVTSENQEQSLSDVYDAAFLETATGIDLERVVSIIGIQRRNAIHATGVQRFIAPSPVTQDYTIQSGTTVQTGGNDPIEFETSEPTVLQLIDDFSSDDVADYSGDTTNASVISDGDAVRGNNVLQLDATADTVIYNGDIEFKRGSKFECHVRPQTDTQAAILFGLDANDPDTYYQTVIDDENGEIRLELVEDGSVTNTIDSTGTTILSNAFHETIITWNITGNISVELFGPEGSTLGSVGGEDNTIVGGSPGFKSLDANDTKEFDFYTMEEVSANIRAKRGGVSGNVGPNSITTMPSPPNGVEETTNLYPTGDSSYEDRNERLFNVGTEEESDSELRNRAESAVTGGGDATHDAIVAELINTVENITSVKIYENNTSDDNTDSGGLPPYSFEVVVFGGDEQEIANAIFDKKAVTARDYGGANGTEVTETVTAETNGETREISFSRPTEISVDMSLDIIVDETYVGDDEIRDKIVEYIGGTLENGSEIVGLGVADNVRADTIKDVVIGGENGVIGLDQSVDGTPLETTPSLTTVDGLEVIEIGESEVAQTDASDASITINKREQ